MINIIPFVVFLFFVIKSADFAMRFASRIADGMKISKYVIGFILVAAISVLPEMFISIASAFQGMPAFGLGTLFGSNVADLTLVFAVIILLANSQIRVESKIIKNSWLYLCTLAVPIVLGLDGYYARGEGLIMILVGLLFYFDLLKKNPAKKIEGIRVFSWKDFFGLVLSMGVLLAASTMTVKFGVLLAHSLHINPVFVGMLFVGISTTFPEMFFSIKAVKNNHANLAIGDILGTVITDGAIIVGILAMIKPFFFNQRIVYVTAMFMLLAAALLLRFMQTGKTLTKKEGLFLLFFYLLFVLTEFAVSNYFNYITD